MGQKKGRRLVSMAGMASSAVLLFWAASGVFLNMSGNVGGMLAPVATPLIAARFGWAGGLYFASFLVLVGVATWLWVNPERHSQTATAG